jgi:polyisoprenyl-phosphate glycosyltransferase
VPSPAAGQPTRIAVVVPVRADVAAVPALARRLEDVLDGADWRLRLVIHTDPGESVRPAHDLARAHRRIAVTGLAGDAGATEAVRHGLAAEPEADVWICLEAGLPEAADVLPLLVDRVGRGDVEAVVAETGGLPLPRARVLGVVARWLPRRVFLDVYMSALRPPARAAVLSATGTDVRSSVARAGLAVGVLRIPARRVPGTAALPAAVRSRRRR